MSDSRPRRPQSPRRRSLEILALSAIAIAQPLFDVVSREGDFFVAHGSRPIDIVLFAVTVYIAPALLLTLAVTLLIRVAPALGRMAYGAVVTLLVALVLLPPLDRLGMSAAASIGASLLAGTTFALALERISGLRSFLALLSPLSLIIPLNFLLLSPTAKLLRAQRVEALEVAIARPMPIVLLLLDELPVVSLMNEERSIDADMFPNFARLAASSHWFRNATAVTHNTNYAVPAILTGRYPDRVRAATASEYPRSLFTMLGGSYDLAAIETQTRLCPADLCGGDEQTPPLASRMRRLLADSTVVYLHIVFPQTLSDRLPAVTATWTDFAAQDPARFEDSSVELAHIFTVDRARVFESFVSGIDRSDRPTFHFLHLMLPHVPWAYLPSGNEYWASITSSAFAEGVARDSTWTEEEWLVAQGYQRHLLQVGFVDTLLGELLDRLQTIGLAEEALLIVTADHGLSFHPGQPGRHATEQNYPDVMAVPLFVRTPGQREGVVSDRNVELVDIVPTVAELVGLDLSTLELPAPIDGESLFATTPERTHKVLRTGPYEGFNPANADLEAKYATLERKLEIFTGGLFSIGPHQQLLGRRIVDLEPAPAAAVEVRLDQPEHFRRVDPASGYVPAHIFGHARWTKPPEQLDLAIAVNGVVQAVTRTFPGLGGERFVAMVPEEALLQGENVIDVFVVDDSGRTAVIRPARRNAAPRYELKLDSSGEVTALVASDGTACTLNPTAVEGGFVRAGTGHLGWARDASGQSPYVVIMTFADGRLVYTTTTGSDPPDSSPVAGREGFEEAGFRFNLPSAIVESAGELRIFAVLGDQGTELEELVAGSR